jgi:hypothetical protein
VSGLPEAVWCVGDDLKSAELVVRGALIFYGPDCMRPTPWCPQDYAVFSTLSGCFCNPITLARVRRSLTGAQ